ncbi:AAA family ATPase [Priestia aryabhattai]
MLRNLNELARSSKEHYLNTFVNKEFKLNRDFKERLSLIMEAKGTTIEFFDYTAEITTSSNKKIFCPNQWFYMATFVVDFVSELMNYKQALESIAVCDSVPMSRAQFFESLKGLDKKDMDEYVPEIKESIIHYFGDDSSSSEYLCKFVSDYDWWSGSKTVNRGDYYVSPTLKLLGLVNISTGYVADITHFLASDRQLMDYALNLHTQLQEQDSRLPINSPAENLIVYGAPGTGKSKYLEDSFANTTRVVFHSEYSYYEFVGSYRPTPLYKQASGELHKFNGEKFELGEPLINYQFIPGPFIKVLIKAFQDPDTKYTLLLEELNRANAPTVFGDIFQLLDRKADGSSQYSINPNEDLNNYLMSLDDIKHYFNEGLYIPKNMSLVATMNSADQGVYVLDSAFKRRWKFKYMPIKEKGFVHEQSLIDYAGESFEWRFILNSINNKLKNLEINEDRLIGPYFINPEEIGDNNSLASKLLIYLWDDVARYKRREFFANEIKTYSELVTGFATGVDVLNIKSSIYELLEREKAEQSEADEQTDEESIEE